MTNQGIRPVHDEWTKEGSERDAMMSISEVDLGDISKGGDLEGVDEWWLVESSDGCVGRGSLPYITIHTLAPSHLYLATHHLPACLPTYLLTYPTLLQPTRDTVLPQPQPF